MRRLLGYKKFISKAGKLTCYIYISCPPSQWEIEHGFVGEQILGDIYIPEEFIHLFTPDAIGKEIVISREVDDFDRKSITNIIIRD